MTNTGNVAKNKVKNKLYAIDYDGCIIDDGLFPEFGSPKPNAIHTMKRILNEGGKIAIWTCRGGDEQKAGVTQLLNEHGIYDFIFNDHFPEILEKYENQSPKIFADYYIDDRSLHAVNGIDWYEIEKLIFGEGE